MTWLAVYQRLILHRNCGFPWLAAVTFDFGIHRLKTRGPHVASSFMTLLVFSRQPWLWQPRLSQCCPRRRWHLFPCFISSSIFLRHSWDSAACLRSTVHQPHLLLEKGGYRNLGKSYPKPRLCQGHLHALSSLGSWSLTTWLSSQEW